MNDLAYYFTKYVFVSLFLGTIFFLVDSGSIIYTRFMNMDL